MTRFALKTLPGIPCMASLATMALAALALPALAQEQGRVISATPVMQQVAVPRQVCAAEQAAPSGSAGNPVDTAAAPAQNCSTQTFFENRASAYNVVYEYNGKQYSVQMPNDPGPTLQLQISPVGTNTTAPQPASQALLSPAQPAAPSYLAPAVVSPAVVYTTSPTVVYAPSPYAAPYYYGWPLFYGPSINIGYRRSWGSGGHHRR